MNGYILISVLWVGYFFFHSLLASEAVKNSFGNGRWYRLFYCLLSTVLLVPIVLLLAGSESPYLFAKAPFTDFLGLAAAAYGVIIIRLSFKHYGFREFIGLRSDRDEAFKAAGILSKIRHPIYAGIILLVVGFVLYIPRMANLLSAFWIFAYLPAGIWLEEKKLVRKYGKTYEEYRSKTPAILPRLLKNKHPLT